MQKPSVLYINNSSEPDIYSRCLDHSGFEAVSAYSLDDAKNKILKNTFGLLLIQYESFRKNIIELCHYSRVRYEGSVIIILMKKAMPQVEKKLFEFGVDDVAAGSQTNPISLMPRIKRRVKKKTSAKTVGRVKLKGGAEVNFARREIKFRGKTSDLKRIPQELLKYFIDNPNRAISREELIGSYIWDNSVSMPDKIEGGRAIDMAVMRLRRYIEPEPSNPQIIKTVHGVGWILAEDAVS